MSLFRRKSDNSSLIFHCLDLSDTELEEITKLVEDNGGKMGDNCPLPIKFMNSEKYTDGMYPLYRVYNVNFIRTCVKTSKLVNLFSFRLSPEMLCESCMVFNFIYGHCVYKGILDVINIKHIPVEPDLSLLSDDGQVDEDNLLETLAEKYRQVGGRQLSIDESQPLIPYTLSQSVQSQDNRCNSSSRKSSAARNRKARSQSFEDVNSNTPYPPSSMDTCSDETYFSEVMEEVPYSAHWLSVSNSQEPQTTDTSESSTTTTSYVRPTSLHSKIRANSTRAEANVSVAENSVIETSPNSPLSSPKSKDLQNFALLPKVVVERCAVPPKAPRTQECEMRNPGTEVVNGARLAFDVGTSRNSVKRTQDRVHPVTENTQCNSQKAEPVPRPKLALRGKSKTLRPNKLPSPIYRPNATSNSVDENKPGPSGLITKKLASARLVLDSSTDDEDLPEQSYSRVRNGKHSHESNPRSRNNQGESEEVPNISRNNANTEIGPRRNVRTRRILLDSDREEEAPQVTRENMSDTRNPSESSTYSISDDDDGFDEVSTERRKKNDKSGRTKRGKALQYAKNWRSNLETSRPTKIGMTRMLFTKSEQKAMVDFLLTHEDIRRVAPKGLKIWHTMLLNGILPHRTSQSLQNHFVKILLPHIQDYFHEMSEDHRKQFEAIQSGSRE